MPSPWTGTPTTIRSLRRTAPIAKASFHRFAASNPSRRVRSPPSALRSLPAATSPGPTPTKKIPWPSFRKILRANIFRNDGHGIFLVGVGPGEVAAGNERSADGGERTRRDGFEAANRWKLAFAIGAVLRKDRIVVGVPVHGDGIADAH